MYRLGEEVALALDVAATEFFEGGRYQLEGEAMTSAELVDYLSSLTPVTAPSAASSSDPAPNPSISAGPPGPSPPLCAER
jgi:enolase